MDQQKHDRTIVHSISHAWAWSLVFIVASKTTSCLPSALRPQPFDGKYTRHLLEQGFFHKNRTPGSFGRLDTWKFSKFGHLQVVAGNSFLFPTILGGYFVKHLEHEQRSTGGLLYLWGYGAYGQLGFGFDDLRWGNNEYVNLRWGNNS